MGTLLAACASMTNRPATTSPSRATSSSDEQARPSEPRLRRDSVARVPVVQTFGNLSIESSVEARCGYRDSRRVVLCLNVDGELNPADLGALRSVDAPDVAIEVRGVVARRAVEHLVAIAPGQRRLTVKEFNAGSCVGACEGRIDLVRAP